MDQDLKKIKNLKKIIKKLQLIKGRHTELVSVYVPQGYDIIKIIQHLAEEQHTASNIKDKNTRKNVIDSLERMIRHLRIYKKTPENGLAIFAGNSSESENKINIQIWSIEPFEPLQIRLYRCDQTFLVDPLLDMVSPKEFYGLIVLDNREGTIGVLNGTSIKLLSNLTSGVPGKIKSGGQSQQRYARLREGAAHDFYKRISGIANKEFYNNKKITGILIGGPGPTKETFLDGDYLNNEVKKKVIATKDLSYTGDFGLKELVEKSQDSLAEQAITKERKILQSFFEMLAKDDSKVAYGKSMVKKAFEYSAVDLLIISEDVSEELEEELIESAEKSGSKYEIVSTDTSEGTQLKEIGGVAAILRFPLN